MARRVESYPTATERAGIETPNLEAYSKTTWHTGFVFGTPTQQHYAQWRKQRSEGEAARALAAAASAAAVTVRTAAASIAPAAPRPSKPRAEIALTCDNLRRPESAPLVLIHAPQAGVSAIGSVRPDRHWSRATELQYEGPASSSTVRFATLTNGGMLGELHLSVATGEVAWSYEMTPDGHPNSPTLTALR